MSEQERRNFVTEFRLEEYRQWLVTSLANSQEGGDHTAALYNALERLNSDVERLNDLVPLQDGQPAH